MLVVAEHRGQFGREVLSVGEELAEDVGEVAQRLRVVAVHGLLTIGSMLACAPQVRQA